MPKPSWLLIPGHMCDSRMWADISPLLLQAGYDVALADLSLGRSIDEMARRQIDNLDGPTRIAGFSMGGMVALRMWAIAPEMVISMALIDTNARPDLPERATMRLEQQQKARAGLLREVITQELVPHYFGQAATADPKYSALVVDMADALGGDVFIRQSEAIRLRPDSRGLLQHITCPCLVIGGLDDRLCSAGWQRELASEIPDSQLILLEGVGHFAPLEAPRAVAKALIASGRSSATR